MRGPPPSHTRAGFFLIRVRYQKWCSGESENKSLVCRIAKTKFKVFPLRKSHVVSQNSPAEGQISGSSMREPRNKRTGGTDHLVRFPRGGNTSTRKRPQDYSWGVVLRTSLLAARGESSIGKTIRAARAQRARFARAARAPPPPGAFQGASTRCMQYARCIAEPGTARPKKETSTVCITNGKTAKNAQRRPRTCGDSARIPDKMTSTP
jgi:hypothetical protein